MRATRGQIRSDITAFEAAPAGSTVRVLQLAAHEWLREEGATFDLRFDLDALIVRKLLETPRLTVRRLFLYDLPSDLYSVRGVRDLDAEHARLNRALADWYERLVAQMAALGLRRKLEDALDYELRVVILGRADSAGQDEIDGLPADGIIVGDDPRAEAFDALFRQASRNYLRAGPHEGTPWSDLRPSSVTS